LPDTDDERIGAAERNGFDNFESRAADVWFN
jgi:hypothetical protein